MNRQFIGMNRILRICAAAVVMLLMCVTLYLINGEPQIRRIIKSEHYILTPIEDYGFSITDRATGGVVGGWVDCYGPLIIRDATGKEYLYTNHELTGSYYVIEPDSELKADIIKMIGEREWYAVDIGDYNTVYDEDTRLSFMWGKGTGIWAGNVVLYDEDDIARLNNIASLYVDIFPDYMKDIDIGYIYAIMEVKKLSIRFDGAWLFVGPNGVQYIDIDRPERGWSLELAGDEYERLESYVRTHYYDLKANDTKLYENWKTIFDELDIEYDPPLDPDSIRYQAALDDLIKIWGTYPAPGMSEEVAEKNLKNHMKEFDEDGYHIGFGSIAGMDATDVDEAIRHRIIDVPEEYREAMYRFEFEELILHNGDSRDTDARSEIFKNYQENTKKADRLAGTWTLGQYDRMYSEALRMAVLTNNPDWEPGEPVDGEYLSTISRETIEAHIKIKDNKFFMTWGDDIDDILSDEINSRINPISTY